MRSPQRARSGSNFPLRSDHGGPRSCYQHGSALKMGRAPKTNAASLRFWPEHRGRVAWAARFVRHADHLDHVALTMASAEPKPLAINLSRAVARWTTRPGMVSREIS